MSHIVVNVALNPHIIIDVSDHVIFELLLSTFLTTLGGIELNMMMELGF
jgi:hypothetical protein